MSCGLFALEWFTLGSRAQQFEKAPAVNELMRSATIEGSGSGWGRWDVEAAEQRLSALEGVLDAVARRVWDSSLRSAMTHRTLSTR